MVLICISLMTNDVEHFLVGLSAIHMSPLLKGLLKSFASVYIRFSIMLLLSDKSSSHILYTSLLMDMRSVIIFCLSMACIFIFLTVIFKTQTLLVLIKSSLSIYFLTDHAFHSCV